MENYDLIIIGGSAVPISFKSFDLTKKSSPDFVPTLSRMLDFVGIEDPRYNREILDFVFIAEAINKIGTATKYE